MTFEEWVKTIVDEVDKEEDKRDTELLKKYYMEYQEVKAHCEFLKEEKRELRTDVEKAYMRGRIAGLEFSIRCNGVSGSDVDGGGQ